jgi:hypothetical protein
MLFTVLTKFSASAPISTVVKHKSCHCCSWLSIEFSREKKCGHTHTHTHTHTQTPESTINNSCLALSSQNCFLCGSPLTDRHLYIRWGLQTKHLYHDAEASVLEHGFLCSQVSWWWLKAIFDPQELTKYDLELLSGTDRRTSLYLVSWRLNLWRVLFLEFLFLTLFRCYYFYI